MRGTSLGCTRRRITSGLPGSQTLTSGSCGAEAEAADPRQLHVEPALVDRVGEGVVDALGAVARAARAHADGDARLVRQQLGQARLVHCVESC